MTDINQSSLDEILGEFIMNWHKIDDHTRNTFAYNNAREQLKALILAEITALVGEPDRQFWDNEQSMCDVCDFQTTDDTKNCICVFRNQLRTEILSKAKQRFGKDN